MEGEPQQFVVPDRNTTENAMQHKLSLIAACALVLLFCQVGRAQDSPSLGDVARQAQRDRVKKSPAKVFTNDDMPAGASDPATAFGAGLGQLAPGPAGGASKAEPSPEQKLALLEAVIEKVDSLDKATLVQNVLADKKGVDFPGRPAWEDRLYAAKQAYVVQARDLVQKARQIVASANSLKGNQDPNDPRIKEMSARLEALARDAVRTDSGFQALMIEGRDLASQQASH